MVVSSAVGSHWGRSSAPQMGNLEAIDRLVLRIEEKNMENTKRENFAHDLLNRHCALFSSL